VTPDLSAATPDAATPDAATPDAATRRTGGAPARATVPAWRRGPLPYLAALGAIVAVAAAGVLAQGSGNARRLDPDGTSEQGARALAVLLRDRGVAVERIGTVAAALAGSDTGTTIFLPQPDLLPAQDVAGLAASTGSVVLVSPSGAALEALAPGLGIAGSAPERERLPGCDLPAALVAGSADLGGSTYVARSSDSTAAFSGCYQAGGRPTVVARTGPEPAVTVVGTRLPFSNAALGRHGNAAFALSLLGSGNRVRWLLPRPAESASASGRKSLTDLLPGRLLLALLQGVVAVGLLALWRARRLGPVVAERLPVVVRAAETTEGRARLYRATSARAAAAAALRAGARARLARRAGLDPHTAPVALVDAVARRTARPTDDVAALLYPVAGPDAADHTGPRDDASLVRLAADLDALDTTRRDTTRRDPTRRDPTPRDPTPRDPTLRDPTPDPEVRRP